LAGLHQRVPDDGWRSRLEQYDGESAAECFGRAAVPVDEQWFGGVAEGNEPDFARRRCS